MSSDPRLVPQVLSLIDGCKILDVGCGKGKMGYSIKVDWWYSSAAGIGLSLKYLVGADIFRPYIKFCKEHRIYDDLILCDATHLPFRKKVFDVILACEVIEHLEKERGYALIREIERASSKSVIITTPRVFTQQDAVDGNVFQKHTSKWSAKEFKSLGYSIIGQWIPFKRGISYLSWRYPGFPQLVSCLVAKKRLL